MSICTVPTACILQLAEDEVARQIYQDPQQSFSRGVSHIDASTISLKGALAGTPRGSRYPPTLQTSLQIVIRPIMGPHINRDPNERQEGGKTPVCTPSLYMASAYCERRITCENNALHSNGVTKLISIGRKSRLS